MKTKHFFWSGIFPVVLMAYGWYLGQLHQSMQDLAGILLFITGAAGFVVAIAVHFALKRFSWRSTWWGGVLIGAGGSAFVFLLVFIYARLHG